MQNSKIMEIEERLRSVEAAVVELASMARMIKVVAMIMAATLGLDVQGMM